MNLNADLENRKAGILNFSSKIENWAEEILEAKMKITEDNPEMVHYWTYFPYDITVRARWTQLRPGGPTNSYFDRPLLPG